MFGFQDILMPHCQAPRNVKVLIEWQFKTDRLDIVVTNFLQGLRNATLSSAKEY
jgi:hypothetical protein